MSLSSDRGRRFEQEVARQLRKKLGARVTRDRRSGAGSHQKSDINDYYRETGLHIEAKSHQTIKIKEFYRQAQDGASVGQVATVVFDLESQTLACMSFDELLNIIAERNELFREIRTLKAPRTAQRLAGDVERVKAVKVASGAKECRAGFLLALGASKCLTKGCTSCRPKKEKRS